MIRLPFQAIAALFTITVTAFLAAGPASAGGPALPEGVIELAQVGGDLPGEALAPLAPLFDGAQVLGIGESAHGSAGYARVQLSLVRELVERHGYRRLLVEVMTDDRALARFLRTGEGDLREILYLNSWQEDHVDRVRLYAWIREFNLRHPEDPVEVLAFDMQMPWRDAPAVRAFLAEVDPALDGRWGTQATAHCFGAAKANQIDWAYSDESKAYQAAKKLDPARTALCREATLQLRQSMRENEWRYVARTDAQAFGDAWMALLRLDANERKMDVQYSDFAQAIRIRERLLGPSAIWQWKGARPRGPRTVILAHNVHLVKTTVPSPETPDEWVGMESLGFQLRAALGDGYRAIALTGYDVQGMFGKPSPAPTSGRSIELRLEGLGRDALLVDPAAPWISGPRDWFVHEDAIPNGRLHDLPASFDRVIFLHRSGKAAFLGKPAR